MRLATVLVGLLVLAGCSDSPKEDAGGPSSSSTTASGDDGTRPAEGAPTSAQPRWQVGQSWTWRLTSATTSDIEATSVVLGAAPADYEVGTSDVDGAWHAYPFHLVGFGTVDAATLAWEAHGASVQLLRFPLTDGDRFTADFWSAPDADVVVTSAPVVTPDGTEPGYRGTAYYAGSDSVFMEADYSPALGQFVRVATRFGADSPFAQATLVGTGSNETGQPFRAMDLARWSARADDPTTLQPRQSNVAAPFDDLLLACFITGQGEGSVTIAGARGGTNTCDGLQGGAGTAYRPAYATAVEGPAVARALPVGQGSVTIEVFGVDTG